MTRYVKRPSKVVVVDIDIFKSEAYAKLSGQSQRILGLFWARRRMEKAGPKGNERWRIANNGEIVFTYKEAAEKFDIPESTFRRGLKQLVEVGFLSITDQGRAAGGRKPSKFSLDERWRHYGTDKFVEVAWEGGFGGPRFKKGNKKRLFTKSSGLTWILDIDPAHQGGNR